MGGKIEGDQSILNRQLFGDAFKWGVSVAAYQIEGAWNAEGKGKSIWDVFTTTKGKILKQQTGQITCDFFNRYKEDIDLIREMNIPNFRFSISWSRILPEGVGAINQQGIDFYNRVINYCLEQNIVPWITLYHWDLPHSLELKGGWTNREVLKWFSDYTEICARQFGDRVKNWIVMNEPGVFVGAGYFLGIHAPGRQGMKNFLPAIHHAVLSMAEAGRILKKIVPDSEIGTTFSCSHIEPYSSKKQDIAAAKRVDTLLNRLFIEPVLGMGYPFEDLPVLKELNKYILPDDTMKMQFDFDFIGIQNYTREIVKHSYFTPYLSASLVRAEERKVPVTLMKWEVYPESIYRMIEKYNQYAQIRKLYITENGAAFSDEVMDNQVDDPLRVKFLHDHISEVLKAKNDGYLVDGYFVWTLTDNFEWAEGYHPRFGLVHVDFETQKRIVKSSGKWYARFLKS